MSLAVRIKSIAGRDALAQNKWVQASGLPAGGSSTVKGSIQRVLV